MTLQSIKFPFTDGRIISPDGLFPGPFLRVHVLHVKVIFSTSLTFSDGYTNTVIFWRQTEKKCKLGFSNKQSKSKTPEASAAFACKILIQLMGPLQ